MVLLKYLRETTKKRDVARTKKLEMIKRATLLPFSYQVPSVRTIKKKLNVITSTRKRDSKNIPIALIFENVVLQMTTKAAVVAKNGRQSFTSMRDKIINALRVVMNRLTES